MGQEHWTAERLRFALWVAGAVTGFGGVGALLSAVGAPETVAWPAAVGAAVAGGWGGHQLMRRYLARR
ncbi:hypothetical protein [Streptomyces pilosus]|uniref:Uncharacterized protein n=1 Tax=Streptomyces pilosus TaxID=28893 RepID=A0A918EX39_9ACTN|nr:hypothetical protein [Streptomyces pilosus]GGQ74581.1 hypothetical protein GCM10010280_21400 [Streptomyces pilosus]GGV60600.1 hypothetical protein GCM10010261_48770 [Streptomyces pilosus]